METPDSAPRPIVQIPPDVRRQLAGVLGRLPRKVRLVLHSRRGENDTLAEAARQLLRVFAEISTNIVFEERDLAAGPPVEGGIDFSPTIEFAPEEVSIRFLGAPLGEEGRTILETMILIGIGSSGLGEQARRVLDRLTEPRRVRLFSSPTCPYCPQQALNVVKAALARPDLVSAEIVDITAHPRLAAAYGIRGTPLTYANDVLIAPGAQTEELFAASLVKLEPQRIFIPESDAPLVHADLVIVGGGPAGLTAGIYAVRAGLKTVLIERDALGGQITTTPVVENYPGFAQIGGKALVELLVAHALDYVQIFPGEEVHEIRPGPPLEVLTGRRRFEARAVLLATGARHRKLGVPGEARLAGHGVTYCSTCDGPLFKDKRVVMVGGGNSAVTEALFLHHIGARVTLVHRRGELRAQEHLTRPLEAAGIPVRWFTEVREIRGQRQVEGVLLAESRTGATSVLPVEGVFIAVGYEPASDLAARLGAELTPEGFIVRGEHHRTSVPGLYSAGDVEGGYKQIVTAVGQGAEAAMSIYQDLVHPYWAGGGGVAAVPETKAKRRPRRPRAAGKGRGRKGT